MAQDRPAKKPPLKKAIPWESGHVQRSDDAPNQNASVRSASTQSLGSTAYKPQAAKLPPSSDQAKVKPNVGSLAEPKTAGTTLVGELPAAGELPGLKTTRRERLMMVPSWSCSMIFHAIVLLVLGLLILPHEPEPPKDLLVTTTEQENVDDFKEIEIKEDLQPTEENVLSQVIQSENIDEDLDIAKNLDREAAASVEVKLSEIGIETMPRSDLLSEIGVSHGNALQGRSAGSRKVLVAQQGGNIDSEQAVARSLHWLALHQNPDGSWNFDHTKGQCQGRCGNPGLLSQCTTGATGLALLPFLGAGQTQVEGEYKKNVAAGLRYLRKRMRNNGSLVEGGRMYDQGICTIALCEAYAMTQSRSLVKPSQAAVNFIISAQDTVGGGWRYVPGQPGDLSVTGWQLMALKSAHLGYLRVPLVAIEGTAHFLDSVQTEDGSEYRYLPSAKPRSSMTAVGLLSRMYLGWEHDRPALKRGVKQISNIGPIVTPKHDLVDPYYNYYATQVMHHYGGKMWKKWNKVMRDFLVRTQAGEGHEKGSWWFGGGHAEDSGGRLYVTAMSCMTLEVYYRYLPLYREESAQSKF